MKLRIALIALLAITVVSGCKKKTHCSAYKDIDADDWFPFTAGQRMVFLNNSISVTTLDTFNIQQVRKSDAYISEDQDLGGSKGDCNTSYVAISKETNPDDNNKPLFYFSYESIKKYNADTVVKFGQVKMFKNSFFDFGEILPDDIKKNPSSVYTYNFEYKDSVIFPMMQVFKNVWSMEVNTATLSNVEIDKIWISKTKGIVGYRRYPTGEIYSRVD